MPEYHNLNLDDLIKDDKELIIKSPYQILGLPDGAPIEKARLSYITLAKIYHPDMVGSHASDDIRERATKQMILINRAYQMIKSNFSPDKMRELFGYNKDKVFNEKESVYTTEIKLEGPGLVTVYDNDYEYWVKGPYLSFCYGPDIGHPWVDDSYQAVINLRHFFMHKEINEGRKITPKLINPFIKCFNLSAEQSGDLTDLLNSINTIKSISSNKSIAEIIMNSLGIKKESETTGNDHIYSLRFRRQLNEILLLVPDPNWGENASFRFDNDNNLILTYSENYGRSNESVFSEADYYLFMTLSYGPLLKSSAGQLGLQ